MTDASLRQLYRETTVGDVFAEARLLRQRVRSGDLSKDCLRLAAHLGDAAAREVMRREIAPLVPLRDVHQWAYGLGQWREAAIFAGAILVRERLALAMERCASLREPVSKLVRSIPENPKRRHRRSFDVALKDLRNAIAAAYASDPGFPIGSYMLDCVQGVSGALRPGLPLANAVNWSTSTPCWKQWYAGKPVEPLHPLELRAAIRDALLPWALRSGRWSR
jgi:hypothetical protein